MNIALCTDLKCLSTDPDSLSVPVPLAMAFQDLVVRLRARFWNPAWKVTELWSESGRRLREDVRVIRQVGKEVIGQRVKEHAAKKAGEKVEPPTNSSGAERIEKRDNVKDLIDCFLDGTDSEEDLLLLSISFREFGPVELLMACSTDHFARYQSSLALILLRRH